MAPVFTPRTRIGAGSLLGVGQVISVVPPPESNGDQRFRTASITYPTSAGPFPDLSRAGLGCVRVRSPTERDEQLESITRNARRMAG